MKTIKAGSRYTIYDNSIQTYDQLPAGTYAIGYNQQEGCFLIEHADIHEIKKILDSLPETDE